MNLEEKLEYKKYLECRDNYFKKVTRLANIRMILFIFMLVSFILRYYYYPILFNIFFIIFLILFIIVIIIHDKSFKIYDYYVKFVEIIELYLDRKNGNWKNFSDKGEDLLVSDKSYLEDLDILGDCSLFQYLSVCKTLGGRECLVNKLANNNIEKEELLNNQKAILELIDKKKFSIEFQIIMKYYEDKKIDLKELFSNLERYQNTKRIDLFIAVIASIICILLFILGIFKIMPLSYFYGMFLFDLLISYLYELIFKEEFLRLNKLVITYSKLKDVFQLFVNNKFSSIKLREIQKEMKKGNDLMKELSLIDNMNSFKNNLLSGLFFNGFLCFNLILLYRYSKFLNCNFDKLKINIYNIEEMEAFISLATLGIVRDKWCIPKYQERIGLDFINIKHPLLDEDICVGNDFSGSTGVNIITGSNMGGKTSFLRMIGINLILMQSGTVVCADSFSSCYFKIFTSMRIADDINKGISTFYGELLRVKDMVEYVNNGNMLVLIDEIFKGTNYSDRMYGAKSVIKKLSNKNIIAFITTHDFELCEEDNVYNYYVKEDYEGDKIVFDYKIRKGMVKSTNAKYLMKKLNIID